MSGPAEFAQARKTFANFPEEIFQLWLDDRIRTNGWPPTGIEWQGFLYGKSIAFWQQVQWNRKLVSLQPDQLTDTSFQLLMQIVEAGAAGRRNLMTMYIPDTAARFRSCVEYVRSHGTTPGTVLLLQSPSGYDVVEGNHRIAALLMVSSQLNASATSAPIQAWVGSKALEQR